MVLVLRLVVIYVLKVLVSFNFDRWGWIWCFGDEFYLCLEYIFQSYYLRNFEGLIFEYFYGFKRVSRIFNNNFDDKLLSLQRYLFLLMLVVFLYVKFKFDQLFERLREEYVIGLLFFYLVRKWLYFLYFKRIFIYLYFFLYCVWELIFLCYYMLYIFRVFGVYFFLFYIVGIFL